MKEDIMLRKVRVARKIAGNLTVKFWKETKEILPKYSKYKENYPVTLTDKEMFFMELFRPNEFIPCSFGELSEEFSSSLS